MYIWLFRYLLNSVMDGVKIEKDQLRHGKESEKTSNVEGAAAILRIYGLSRKKEWFLL